MDKVTATCMLALILAACQKAPNPPPDQSSGAASSTTATNTPASGSGQAAPEPTSPATASQTNSPAAANSPAPPAMAPAPEPPPPAAAPVASLPTVIPAGTRLTVRLESTVGSKSAPGDSFSATLVKGVSVHGVQALGRESAVVGRVVQAQAAGKFAGAASLQLQLTSVANHDVATGVYTQSVQGKGKRTAEVIGGTAIVGALLGGLAGHGRGALIGAAAGGGVGTLGAAETGNNRDIVLQAGTVLTFRLRHSLTLPVSSTH